MSLSLKDCSLKVFLKGSSKDRVEIWKCVRSKYSGLSGCCFFAILILYSSSFSFIYICIATHILSNPGIDGEWLEWGEWSQCSTSCGKGSEIRARACGGSPGSCSGDPTETKDCLVAECSGCLFCSVSLSLLLTQVISRSSLSKWLDPVWWVLLFPIKGNNQNYHNS